MYDQNTKYLNWKLLLKNWCNTVFLTYRQRCSRLTCTKAHTAEVPIILMKFTFFIWKSSFKNCRYTIFRLLMRPYYRHSLSITHTKFFQIKVISKNVRMAKAPNIIRLWMTRQVAIPSLRSLFTPKTGNNEMTSQEILFYFRWYISHKKWIGHESVLINLSSFNCKSLVGME